MARRMRTVKPVLPEEIGIEDGLAYSLWLPPEGKPVAGGVVILHGAGSCKENHHDFARAALAAGLAAIAFDQRGHGESPGPMDGRALGDVVTMAESLRSRMRAANRSHRADRRCAGRAWAATWRWWPRPRPGRDAVVAICPASGEGLARALAAGRLGFEADVPALERLLTGHDLNASVAEPRDPRAADPRRGRRAGARSALAGAGQGLAHPSSRLIVVPGGHHRSIQHDPEMTAVSLRFLSRVGI